MPKLYVHFLDVYHYSRATRSHSELDIAREARRACRLAVLTHEEVFIPASSFFESDLARSILDSHPLLTALGRISLIAGEATLEDHREAKIRQYGDSSPLGLDIAYGSRAKCSARYVQRRGSARRLIERNWFKQAEENLILIGIDPLEELSLPTTIENTWVSVPDELGDRAFITGHAYDILRKKLRIENPLLHGYTQRVIESSYMESYALSLNAGVMEDLICLRSPFPLYPSLNSSSYTELLQPIQRAGLLDLLDGSEEQFLASESVLRDVLGDQKHQTRREIGDTGAALRNPSLVPVTLASRRWTERPSVGIVTALPYEYLAIKSLLTDTHLVTDDRSAQYLHGLISPYANHLPQSVVLIQTGAGTKRAAARTAQLITRFESIQDVVMVGIAGAIPDPAKPDKDVRLGDVVVSDRAGVIDVDNRERNAAGDQSRSHLPPPSERLLAAFNTHELLNAFLEEVDSRLVHLIESDSHFRRPARSTDRYMGTNGRTVRRTPRDKSLIFRGLIASGDSLVRDRQYRDQIKTEFGALAMEMEAAGVAAAAHTAARQYLVVRAFVDYCDGNKSDVWHWYAAATAAAVATTIISSLDSIRS